MTARLSPLAMNPRLAEHLPRETIYLGRADAAASQWLPLDGLTFDRFACMPRLLMSGLSAFTHKAAMSATDAMLNEWAAQEEGGAPVLFAAGDDMLALAERESARGAKVMLQHFSPRADKFAVNWLTPPALLADLNNKANLGDWTPREFTPERRVVAPDALAAALEQTAAPFVLKVGFAHSTGGGAVVRICRSAADALAAADAFKVGAEPSARFVIERLYSFSATWCGNALVADQGCIFAGASQQRLDENRRQIGNINGEGFAAPDGARDAVLAVAENARAAGYRGVAGMDFGVTADGRLLIFDLNFRLNACTRQLFIHESACARIGATVSQPVNIVTARPLADAARDIEALVKSGRVVPAGSFDLALHEQGGGRGGVIEAIAFGRDRDELGRIVAQCAAIA